MGEERNLLENAKKGDTDAFRKLFSQYQPIVFKLQKKYFLKDFDTDDWHQEGRIIFYQSLQSYNQDYGITLGSFFRMNFTRHICSLIRRQSAEKRKIDVHASSLEENLEKTGEQIIFRQEEQQNLPIQYVVARESLKDFHTHLSEFEYQVYLPFINGASLTEISRLIDCSEAKVTNAIDRIKRKFKDSIES